MTPKHIFVGPLLFTAACFTAPGTRVFVQGTFEQPGINGKPGGLQMQSPVTAVDAAWPASAEALWGRNLCNPKTPDAPT
jgi:uncharacterized membrane protein